MKTETDITEGINFIYKTRKLCYTISVLREHGLKEKKENYEIIVLL